MDKPGTTPTSTVKSYLKEKCAGEYKADAEGNMIYCSKGYYNYESKYNQQERKFTLQERVANFFRGLVGWSFWLVILLMFLFPSLLGLIVGRILEAANGIGTKAFKQVSIAIQNVKNKNLELKTELEKATDTDVRVWIEDFKKKNGIK